MTEQNSENRMNTAELINSLSLEPHPEGGYFRRTWTAPKTVQTPRGARATASGILFLLDRDEEACWHQVLSDELWLWHGPGSLEIQLGGSGEQPEEGLAPTFLSGADGAVQLLVPAGYWQRTFARESHCLATCIVSPEFSYEDWQLAHSETD